MTFLAIIIAIGAGCIALLMTWEYDPDKPTLQTKTAHYINDSLLDDLVNAAHSSERYANTETTLMQRIDELFLAPTFYPSASNMQNSGNPTRIAFIQQLMKHRNVETVYDLTEVSSDEWTILGHRLSRKLRQSKNRPPGAV